MIIFFSFLETKMIVKIQSKTFLRITWYYLWETFHDIWSLSKIWKLDIKNAISARKMKILKQVFLQKKKKNKQTKTTHSFVVVWVPNLYLSARSFLFLLAFSKSHTLFPSNWGEIKRINEQLTESIVGGNCRTS